MFVPEALLIFSLLPLLTEAQWSCTNTGDNSQGKCITIRECPKMLAIMYNQRRSNQELNLLRYATCSRHESLPWVCCSSQQPQGNQGTSVQNYNSQELFPAKCGRTSGSDRIVGGTETALDAYPWLILVEYLDRRYNTVKPLCGGSVITARYVLTAAHCITVDPRDYSPPQRIRLGEHDLRTEKDCRVVNEEGDEDCNDGPVYIPVESYKYHENYVKSDKSGHNDIGLIRMARAVVWTDFIQPVCLPTVQTLRSLKANDEVYAAGWGKTETTTRSEVKLDIKIHMTTQSVCQSAYNRFRTQLFEGQICAGGETGKDTCNGDSGGPLMLYQESSRTWQVVGVVSFGPNHCGTSGIPGVYTNVAYYLDWIKSNVKP